jgi:hypothetical protein
LAFHTKAIGQLDVLYSKPGSDFVPKWLVDNEMNLCGRDREVAVKANNAEQGSRMVFDIDSKSKFLLVIGFATAYWGTKKANAA